MGSFVIKHFIVGTQFAQGLVAAASSLVVMIASSLAATKPSKVVEEEEPYPLVIAPSLQADLTPLMDFTFALAIHMEFIMLVALEERFSNSEDFSLYLPSSAWPSSF